VLLTSRVKDGLCSTCDNAPTCSYLRSRQRPVFQCEEFSAFTPPDVRTRKPSLRMSTPNNPGPTAVRPNNLLGLCSTCEDWETCAFPRSEGGVWYCEEYR
jgi:hypothetical protein